MATDLSHTLTIGVSSRALFDLESENHLFEESGVETYRAYQIEHEGDLPAPGAAFPLVQALLDLNRRLGREVVTVTLLSRNSPDLGLRLTQAASHYGLEIKRWAFTSGEPVACFLKPFQVDLFLSRDPAVVDQAVSAGVAAAVVYPPKHADYAARPDTITIAFDADAVIFSGESEAIFRRDGLQAFLDHEQNHAKDPMAAGPMARLLKTLSTIQKAASPDVPLVRIVVVTARNAPAHERVLHTLRLWDIKVDQVFMLGGLPKAPFLNELRPHLFFDDQEIHAKPAAEFGPACLVPYRSEPMGIDINTAKNIGDD